MESHVGITAKVRGGHSFSGLLQGVLEDAQTGIVCRICYWLLRQGESRWHNFFLCKQRAKDKLTWEGKQDLCKQLDAHHLGDPTFVLATGFQDATSNNRMASSC